MTNLPNGKNYSVPNQLEYRITARYWHEILHRSISRYRKVTPHSQAKTTQIRFEYFRLLLIRHDADPELQTHPAFLERHLLSSKRIARPLRVPASRNQESLVVVTQDIHRRREDRAALAPSNLQEIIVFETEPKADESPEPAIQETLGRIRANKARGLLHESP
jgi:hypothetical protein